ncbi:glycosyltransferase family 61 protein [Synechococcus sp. FGCU-3]|nr:glycosyltransferase family 61 protein [Synechococcus sp. FGCU3]
MRNVYRCDATLQVAISALNGLSNNYFHFLVETLPFLGSVSIALDQESGLASKGPIACFVRKDRPQFVDYWINAGLADHLLVIPWSFNKVIVRSLLQPTLPYHVLSKENIPLWGIQRYLASGLDYIRMLGYRATRDVNEQHTHKKIFISRRGLSRVILNEDDVDALLHKHNYIKIFLEDLEIPDQIALFRSASHLVCLHGAGMANLIFTNQPQVIELFPSARRHEMLHFYAQLSGWSHAKHSVLICESDVNENINVNIKSLEQFL